MLCWQVHPAYLLPICRREVERRTHPLSQSDFELLSSELEAWRQQQTAAIKAAAQQQDQQERVSCLAIALHTANTAKQTACLWTTADTAIYVRADSL